MNLSKYTVAAAFSLVALPALADTTTPTAGAPVTMAINQVQQVGAALVATGTFNANAASTKTAGTAMAATNSASDSGSSSTGSEPGTYVLLAAALAAVGFVARRRQT